MKKHLLLLTALCLSALSVFAQKKTPLKRPKMVVGIIVDQMRYDYITRFWDEFSEDGFKRMVKEGTTFRDMHYNYAPTCTGPGHSTVWSGAYPANSGIANNSFYDRKSGKMVYCVTDTTQTTVGANDEYGQCSPFRMKVTNLGDELKMVSNQRSKVIAVSFKDRAAVLPGGHFADGAFWFDYKTGDFISSSYYMKGKDLPAWVQAYNQQKRAAQLVKQPWKLLFAEDHYSASIQDNNRYEGLFTGEKTPTFPHDIKAISRREKRKGKPEYGILAKTPWGNQLTVEMAEAAIKGEQLGTHAFPDMLSVSFSCTDYVGHQFAPNSREVEDIYLRLDRQLAQLFKTIDSTVGMNNVVVFLTADHAGAFNANYVHDLGFQPAVYVKGEDLVAQTKAVLNSKYGQANWVMGYYGEQIYLNRQLIAQKGLNLAEVQKTAADELMKNEYVKEVATEQDLLSGNFTEGYKALLKRGCHPENSGDLFMVYQSGVLMQWGDQQTGTSHSMTYNYDTHVPYLMMGYDVPKGKEVNQKVAITQIAPTIANKLKMTAPSAAFEPVLPLVCGAN